MSKRPSFETFKKEAMKDEKFRAEYELLGEFFENLKKGLEEAIAYEKGKLDLRSELIEIPAPPTKRRQKLQKNRN